MKNERQINDIINLYAPDIASGQATVDAIIEKYPQYAQELQVRLEALQWLTVAKKNLEPRSGFIAASRNYIEQKTVNIQQQNAWQRVFTRFTPEHWAFYITAPALIVVLLALIFNSLILTARLALPGDALYSTKLLIENFRLALTVDQAKKTDLYIDYTRERSSEFIELVLDGDYKLLPSAAMRLETSLVNTLRSLNTLDKQEYEIAQPMTAELRDTLSSELTMLRLLKGSSPPSATPGINLVMNVAQSGLMALR
jgi:hypothetical protein